MILMVLPLVPKDQIHLDEVMEFIFEDLYGDAYGLEGSTTEIGGSRDYLADIKARVLREGIAGWFLGSVATKKEYRELLYWAKREGLYELLDL